MPQPVPQFDHPKIYQYKEEILVGIDKETKDTDELGRQVKQIKDSVVLSLMTCAFIMG